jgi:hypothetical protein
MINERLKGEPRRYDRGGNELRGTIEAAKYPMLLDVATALRKPEAPWGPYFESIPNIFERWAYGEDSETSDKFLAGLELMP